MTGADEDARGTAPADQPSAQADADPAAPAPADPATPAHANPAAPAPSPRRAARAIDIIAVVILSIATVSSAWCAYQATRWSGVQAVNYGQASALRVESTRASNRADTLSAIDVQLFSDWVAALSEKDTRRADFLRERFREEFRPAFTVWLNSVPKGTIPPGSPFTLPEYSLAAQRESDRLVVEAEAHFATANEANQTGDNFVLTTVLFATVLFFAGIASHFASVGIKRTMIVLGLLLWVAAVGIMFSLPQNVGF